MAASESGLEEATTEMDPEGYEALRERVYRTCTTPDRYGFVLTSSSLVLLVKSRFPSPIATGWTMSMYSSTSPSLANFWPATYTTRDVYVAAFPLLYLIHHLDKLVVVSRDHQLHARLDSLFLV